MRALLGVLLLSGLAAGCPSAPPVVPTDPPTDPSTPAVVDWRMSKSGLGFRLSDAEPLPLMRPAQARTTALSNEDANKVFRRLPPMKAPARKKAFALRDRSRPAPRPGRTIRTPFPAGASAAPSRPLL